MLAIPWQHILEPGSDKLVLIGAPLDAEGNQLPFETLTGDSPAELEVVAVGAIERYTRQTGSRQTESRLTGSRQTGSRLTGSCQTESHQTGSRSTGSRLTTGYLFLDGSSLSLDVARKDALRQDLEQTLGDACRLFPHQLLVQLQKLPRDWTPDPLFAFGFRQLKTSVGSAVFEFRLSDYKAPPAWLNARFWANPERFEQTPDVDEFSDLTGSFDDTSDETIDEEWD